MTILSTWAARHNIPAAALAELRDLLVGADTTSNVTGMDSEAGVQSRIRLEASRRGMRLFRNNVGAGHVAESGSFMRWGLCNDSAELNAQIKSADLIGICPVTVSPEHVGSVIGQFWSVECKRPGWKYSGSGREPAQLRWIEMVTALGGRASFSTGEI